MSWLFSQALVAEYSAATCLDGALSAPLRLTPMPQAFLSPDKMTGFSQPSLSGMTFAPLTASLGAELLTWFLAAFPVRTYPQPTQRGRASRVSAAGCGKNSGASFAKWDRATSSWRTHRDSLFEGSMLFSGTWPKWGSMRNGECWERQTLERTIDARGYGYWPTPQATDGMRARMKVESMQKVHADSRGGRSYLARVLAHEFGLSQSTEFTEWLMIWPEGWTSLEPLAMDKFQQWQQQHLPSSQDRSDAA